VQVVNLHTNKVARIIGKVENTERFLRIALYQGGFSSKKVKKLPAVAANVNEQREPLSDPTLLCCAFKKHRIYLFSRREPEDAEDATKGRDVFNEKPPPEELLTISEIGKATTTSLPENVILHTTLGDIHVRLYPEECPRTVENFTTHCHNGYYDNLIFHRVIKGFMVQTGDPLGDGTGGQSVWGGEFEDEFHKSLRHDRPFTLSMANAGPNTNGSQFFITTVATPWLDNKHTVFGRVSKGMDVVQAIEKVKTDKNDKPYTDVKILNVTVTRS
jgi:peptidylprolyl isomerase domain and WD repeat-containing protein 1